MLRITPTTKEQHERAILRSIITQLNRPEGDEILKELLELPTTNNAEEIRALHLKISTFYDNESKDNALDIDDAAYDPSKKNFYNALFNLMLLLAKYHPFNNFDGDGNLLSIISLDVIDLQTAVITTHAYFDIPDLYNHLNTKLQQIQYENAVRDVEEKPQIRNPSSQTIISDRELDWLRECFLAAPQSCWQKYQNYAGLNQKTKQAVTTLMTFVGGFLSLPLAASPDVTDVSSNWFAQMALSCSIVVSAGVVGNVIGRPIGTFLGEAHRKIFPKEEMRAIPPVTPPQYNPQIDSEQSAIHVLSCIKSSSPVQQLAPQKETKITVEEKKEVQPAPPANTTSVSSLSFLAHSPESAPATEPLLPQERPAKPNERLLRAVEANAKKQYGSGKP